MHLTLEFLRDQSQLFGFLNRLRSPFCIELHEKIGRMCFHRVERNKEFIGDLLIGKSTRHKLKNFILPLADPGLGEKRFIELKIVGRHRHKHFFRTREPKSGPDTKRRTRQRNDSEIKFERQIANEQAVLKKFQQKDQGCE